MVRNQEKLAQVVSLRKRGFTLDEIAKYCDISKSTASEWLKNNNYLTVFEDNIDCLKSYFSSKNVTQKNSDHSSCLKALITKDSLFHYFLSQPL